MHLLSETMHHCHYPCHSAAMLTGRRHSLLLASRLGCGSWQLLANETPSHQTGLTTCDNPKANITNNSMCEQVSLMTHLHIKDHLVLSKCCRRPRKYWEKSSNINDGYIILVDSVWLFLCLAWWSGTLSWTICMTRSLAETASFALWNHFCFRHTGTSILAH